MLASAHVKRSSGQTDLSSSNLKRFDRPGLRMPGASKRKLKHDNQLNSKSARARLSSGPRTGLDDEGDDEEFEISDSVTDTEPGDEHSA